MLTGGLLASTLRFATPLAYAAMGGIFSERSGVVNIGLEGMMLMGAFFAVWGSDVTGSWVLGTLIALAAGGLMGLLHAIFSITLRSDQIVGGTAINFGEYAIQALEPAYVTNRQIESARIAMTRHIRRGGKVWISIYPDRPLTKKPAETRMGSGKGSPEWWIANVKPGRVMFELSGVSEDVAREAMRRAMHKLPMKCRFDSREAGEF